MKESASFAEASTGSCFSFDEDEEHTVKFEIYLMSTDPIQWGEYTGTYFSETEKNILFAVSPFYSSFSKNPETGGNLIDNCSFSDSEGNNLLVNAGFDDIEAPASYKFFKAANSPTPQSGIGWCSTASDYSIEVGNLKKGNAYGINATTVTTVLNAPTIREGEQFAELNANQESSLYQIVNTDEGKMYRWSLSHRGRDGKDTMALIIGPGQEYAPTKATKQSRDQLMQIVDWLYSQTDMALDIPEQGCSNKITLYSSKFNSNGGWELSSNLFSWKKDSEHTEEWSVWIISSINDAWHDYGEIDDEATYDYEYIVPAGHSQSIFGFVSHSSTKSSGVKDVTYGNLLDNISFKEYYYVNVDNTANSSGGNVYLTNDDGTFLPDIDSETSGWAFAESDLTVHIKEGYREFIGAYIGDVYVPKSGWEYDEEKGEYFYRFESVNSSISINIIYVANTVVYDSRNNYEYQYDGSDGGFELQMGPEFKEYISHAPEFDDGWQFVGWKYLSTVDNSTHMLEAVHKVTFEENLTDISSSSFSIYRILADDETELVAENISYDKGVTFIAEWKYRQRVVSKTFDQDSSQYEISAYGGHAEINVLLGEDTEKTKYYYNSAEVGEELYVSSDNVYINVTAHHNVGFKFDGWYDERGNLVSRSTSYTYKVESGKVVELYAYFAPAGYNVMINTDVVGDPAESARYFAINCTFSNLRENGIYKIAGLYDGYITVNGLKVTNPITLKANESGSAETTIYMKDGDSADFVHLPEDCVYSVQADGSGVDGYSVRGEVSNQTLLTESIVDLIFYQAGQSVFIASGRHYEGIVSDANPGEITITKNSSYTFDVQTKYTPSAYTNVNASLCFYDVAGTAAAFAAGTRILMIDLTNANNPRYYMYVVPDSGASIDSIRLDGQFAALGSSDCYERAETGEDSMILERLVFVVDYVGTENRAESGKISLVYDDESAELGNAIKPLKKTVNIGTDTTKLTATAQGSGRLANVGAFTMNITVEDSSPAVNTAYEDSLYAVKLSIDGGLPDGSYAEFDGNRYYSNNGYITVSQLIVGDCELDIYSPLPIDLSDGKATFKATLLPAISTSAQNTNETGTTVGFDCVDVGACGIDADIANKVLSPGPVSRLAVKLRHEGITHAIMTVIEKNPNGNEVKAENVRIDLPDGVTDYSIVLENELVIEPGATYILLFDGFDDDLQLFSDECCIVGGYK